MTLPAALNEAIVFDELDIASGVHGPLRLKSSYQPIFSRRGGELRLTGLQGACIPFRHGRPIATDELAAEFPPERMAFLSVLALTLQLRNYGHVGVVGLDLHVGVGPGLGGLALQLLSGLYTSGWEGIALGPEKLVCEILPTTHADPDFWDGLEELRWKGVRLAGSFGADRTLPAEAKADVVRIESQWFRKICSEPTVRLLGPMISVMRSHGSRVLIGGIETARQLRIALEAGADHYQGDFLAGPLAAGSSFEEAPLAIASLLGEGQNVLSLRR